MADQKETIVLDFQVDTKDAVVSIESLTKANKELREERKKLNLNSEEGVKRANEINSSIDKNTQVIKNNSSALEKQRLNVGNYTNSIKDAAKEINIAGVNVGGLTKKFELLSKSPLLIAITAITAAFGLLMTYFKNTGEGEDKLAEITASLSVVFEGLMRIVEAVGKFLFQTIEFVGAAALKVIGLVNPAAATAMQAAIAAGKAIAKLDDEIDQMETDMVLKRAETDLRVSKLRARAIEEEGSQKKATIGEAIKLEKELAQLEVDLAGKRVVLWLKEHRTKTDLTDKEKNDLNQLLAAQIRAEKAAFDNTLKLKKEFEKLENAEQKSKKDIIENEIKEFKGAEDIKYATVGEKTQQALAARIAASGKYMTQIAKEAKAHNDSENNKTRIEKLEQQVRFQNAIATFAALAGLFEQGTAAYKIATFAKLTIDTAAAISSLTAASEANPLNALTFGGAGAAQFTLGLIRIFANIGQATELLSSFSEGGYTGSGGKYQPAGIVHAGEVVWNQSDVAAVGGPARANAMRPSYSDGGIVAKASTMGMKGMGSMPVPQVYLSYKEFTEFTNRVQFKESLASA